MTRTRLTAMAAVALLVLAGCSTPTIPDPDPSATPSTSRTDTSSPVTTSIPPSPQDHPAAEVLAGARSILDAYRAGDWDRTYTDLTRQSRRHVTRTAWTVWMSSCEFDYSGIAVNGLRGTGNDLAVVTFGSADRLLRYQRGAWRLELAGSTVDYLTVNPAPACESDRPDRTKSPTLPTIPDLPTTPSLPTDEPSTPASKTPRPSTSGGSFTSTTPAGMSVIVGYISALSGTN